MKVIYKGCKWLIACGMVVCMMLGLIFGKARLQTVRAQECTSTEGSGETEEEIIEESDTTEEGSPTMSISCKDGVCLTTDEIVCVAKISDADIENSTIVVCVTRTMSDGMVENKVLDQELFENNVEKELSFKEEGNYKVYMELTDEAEEVITSNTVEFAIDKTAPVISRVTYSDTSGLLTEKYHSIYSNKAILVEFFVCDQVSGVEENNVYVTIGNSENRGEDTQLYIAKKSLEGNYYIYVPTDLKVDEFNDTITIWAKDRLGNEGFVVSDNIIYSTEKPEISMECDVDYNCWTNEDITFHTTVVDNKTGICEIVYKVNGKTVKKMKFEKQVFRYSYDVVASEEATKDGGYAVTVEAVSNTGTRRTMKRQVYIDKTAPVVKVSGVVEGEMTNRFVTLQFQCWESFFSTNTVNITVERSLDGVISAYSIANFLKDSKEEDMDWTFREDGTYKVTIAAVDKAGNEAVPQTISFSIDTTPPDIQIKGTDNYQMWDCPVGIEFVVNESFYEGDEVMIFGTRRNIDGKLEDVVIPKFSGLEKNSSLLWECLQDGIYELVIRAKDGAGNQNSSTIHFTIDQSAPEIKGVAQHDGECYKYFQLADSLEQIFKDLTVVSYQMLLNGLEYNGTDVITQEGKYHLYVEAVDELGHKATESIEFLVDGSFSEESDNEGKKAENLAEDEPVVTTRAEESVINEEKTTKERTVSDTGKEAFVADAMTEDTDEETNSENSKKEVLCLAFVVGVAAVGFCCWIWLWIRRKKGKD